MDDELEYFPTSEELSAMKTADIEIEEWYKSKEKEGKEFVEKLLAEDPDEYDNIMLFLATNCNGGE